MHNLKSLSYNHCCSGKTTSITYSACVSVALGVVLGIQYVMCMCHIVICDRSTLRHKRHDFPKNIDYKMCILVFYAAFVRNISLSKKNRLRYNYTDLHIKHQSFLSDFNKIFIFATSVGKTLKYQIL
jgi:hypothetical protein